jgi:hypothetical protein
VPRLIVNLAQARMLTSRLNIVKEGSTAENNSELVVLQDEVRYKPIVIRAKSNWDNSVSKEVYGFGLNRQKEIVSVAKYAGKSYAKFDTINKDGKLSYSFFDLAKGYYNNGNLLDVSISITYLKILPKI